MKPPIEAKPRFFRPKRPSTPPPIWAKPRFSPQPAFWTLKLPFEWNLPWVRGKSVDAKMTRPATAHADWSAGSRGNTNSSAHTAGLGVSRRPRISTFPPIGPSNPLTETAPMDSARAFHRRRGPFRSSRPVIPAIGKSGLFLEFQKYPFLFRIVPTARRFALHPTNSAPLPSNSTRSESWKTW